MPRYNLFETSHLALQDALFMGAQSFSKQYVQHASMSIDIQKLKSIIECSLQLIHLKELFVLPALEAYEPAVVDALKQQHQLANGWAKKMQAAFLQPADEPLAILYKKYMCAQLQCGIKCEDMLNPVLWFYYSDKELQELEQPLLQATGILIERQAA